MEQPKEDIGTKKDLVLYRLQTARSDLKSAKISLAAEEYKRANNRAYYAIFHAINAVHAVGGKAYSKLPISKIKLNNGIGVAYLANCMEVQMKPDMLMMLLVLWSGLKTI